LTVVFQILIRFQGSAAFLAAIADMSLANIELIIALHYPFTHFIEPYPQSSVLGAQFKVQNVPVQSGLHFLFTAEFG
jgi:hypothetical protein